MSGIKGRSGGKRINTGIKKMDHGLAPWPIQLERALKLSVNRPDYILPREHFFTKSQVAQVYGKKAAAEFGTYFKSLRRFNQRKADEVRHRQSMGLYTVPPASWPKKSLEHYTPEKYANYLVKHKCYSWESVLKDEHWRDVWMMHGDSSK